jgi:hypothetical protein
MIYPELVDLSFDSVPSGLTLKLDGISRVTPFSDGSVIGFQHSVEAPNQTLGMSNFMFQSWSDGGAMMHPLIVPGTNMELMAMYRGFIEGAPAIESAAWAGNVFQLTFSSMADRLYRVERSPTMLPGSWTTLADQVPGTGRSVVIIDPSAGSLAQAFYRVVLLPVDVGGPPGFSTAAGATDQWASTLSTTLVSSGANRLLLAGLCWNGDDEDTVLSVTYDGVPCAHVITTNWFYGSGKVALYSLAAPPAGSHTLQIIMSGSIKELSLSGMILTNVDQLAPLGLPSGNDSEGPATSIDVSVPSTGNDLIVDLLGYYAFDPLPGAGQSERIVSLNSGYASNRMSTRPGAASSTIMSWTMSDATEISLIAVAVKGL